VAPTFSHLPWYADHPTDKEIRQETYLLRVVLPLVERTYPVQSQLEGRLLIGFSKSGFGAWTLLLRHPEVFGRAAAWDAPLMMDRLGKYGTDGVFGTPENFGAMVKQGYPMVYRPAEVQMMELREVAGALWQRVRITDQAGAGWYLDYMMVETAEGWQINAVQILPAPDVGA
jgi:hypothetical protein